MGNLELNLDADVHSGERAFLVVREAVGPAQPPEYYAAPTAGALTAALANEARCDLYIELSVWEQGRGWTNIDTLRGNGSKRGTVCIPDRSMAGRELVRRLWQPVDPRGAGG